MRFHNSESNPLPIILTNLDYDWVTVSKDLISTALLALHAGGIEVESVEEFHKILRMLADDYKLIELRIFEEKLQLRKLNYGN